MGGRGASSGISDSGKRYGTEYKTIAQFGNVKVVRANDGGAKAPMETMTPGRVYATVQNPFIISKYKGLDPEVKSGIDANPYPRAMTFLLGLSLQF